MIEWRRCSRLFSRHVLLSSGAKPRHQKNGHIALVLGNVQYCGVPVRVDQITAEIGEALGLDCTAIIVARRRGNSPQQVTRFGKSQSAESVIVFRRTSK